MSSEHDWIEAAAKDAIDPERVRVALQSLCAAWPDALPPLPGVVEQLPAGGATLIHLFSVSPISAEKIVKDPGALLWIAHPEVCASARGPGRMLTDLAELKSGAAAFDPAFLALRRFKNRELLRIALREVAGLSALEQTTQELTHIAEICLREVCDGWLGELSRRWGKPATEFAVLAMGKFGGRELNYSSDIDVIFFYGEDGALNPNFSYHQFFDRVAEKVVATFSSADAAGSLFRIDLRLRPEGASGPLTRSLESMENYYAGFGETWERMALIKARGVAGSEELSYEFCHRLQPFIFPRALSPDVFDEISAIKTRIERDIVGHEDLKRNVKLGYGGIREIEFVVQTFQLLHGARHAFLQDRSTLKTLRALEEHSIMPRAEGAALAAAYRFLRTVEHRLQIEREAQTHTLPDKPDALARLAASLGFAGAEEFQRELARHTGAVRTIFDKVLRSGEGVGAVEVASDLSFFRDPQQAAKTLASVSEGSPGAHVAPRTKRLFAKLEPLLLDWLKNIADPDVTLARFVRFVERYGIRGLLFETLVRNPRLLELLIRLFDSSRFVSDIVLRRPGLIEEIARGGLLNRSLGVADYLEGLRRNDENLPWMDWVRVYRRAQIVRIFLRDVLSLVDIRHVHAEYSALAEACLLFVQRALGIESELTVVAMGKFGGRELSYGCDLDVVFVGENAAPAERLIQAMTATTAEGIVFPVDARLRPEGEKGMLVVPLSSYERYFEGRAQTWEAQALTKARPICGPLQAEFLAFAQGAWQRFGQRPGLEDEIRAMHGRVVRERGGGDDLLDFKTGVGGLMELEFSIQALQMAHGIWENNTLEALSKLAGRGIVPAETEPRLAHAYLFLRRVEAVLRRVENSSLSHLPADEAEQKKLAIRLGFKTREDFLAEYRKARAEIHGAFGGGSDGVME
jgi:[glutamine synthetase] adenylyltransferase / [glutamine synthetase]-adenylyl-L-tyrosine phosphorylase